MSAPIVMAAPWCKQLYAHLPPLGSQVCVFITPCGFCGGQNRVWVGFSWGFSRFPLPQISFHFFSIHIHFVSFHFIHHCDSASGMVGWHPCYTQTFKYRGFSAAHPSPQSCVGHELFIFYRSTCNT